MKSRSHEIGTLNLCIALKFDRHIGSTAAEVPVKFQSDQTFLNTNFAASRLNEILRKDIFSDIETGPWSPLTMLTYLHAASSAHVVDSNWRTLFQYPMILRRLILRSRKFSKPRDLYLELYDCSEIWQSCTSAAVLQMCLSNFRAIR